ncbi:MAG: glutamate--tRNA ligase [Gammaproteobacteria bacterium]|nr:glutamate--tRNA ligase [Gammaproteobacteria bacterium]
MKIRTRFAPSPTGYLHIGGARTALFSWLFARKYGGTFVLRIEDTDRERSTDRSVNAILDAMTWLALDYDEGPFYQTQRFDRYREVIEQMLAAGTAYRCYCSKERLEQVRTEQMARKEKPRYDGKCRHGVVNPPIDVRPVVRFRNPQGGAVVFDDLIRGRVVFANNELDDLIIARGDGTPTYNFTVVVDDMDMNITHVIRGDDHVANTPRQLNILQAIGATAPIYAHVPMILGPDGARLSKRHGAVGVMQYRDDGYLPEALLNYLARLGWSHGDQEIFSIDEMIQYFDVAKIHRSPAAYNPEKLLWMNQHYIKTGAADRIAYPLGYQLGKLGIDNATGPALVDVVQVQRERSRTLVEMAKNSAFIYSAPDGYDAKDAAAYLTAAIAPALADVADRLSSLPQWTAEALHQTLTATADAHALKFGKLAQALRVAIVGRATSPPIDSTLEIVGKKNTLLRVANALNWLAGHRSVVSI